MKQYESPDLSYFELLGKDMLTDSTGLLNYGDDWGKEDGFDD